MSQAITWFQNSVFLVILGPKGQEFSPGHMLGSQVNHYPFPFYKCEQVMNNYEKLFLSIAKVPEFDQGYLEST